VPRTEDPYSRVYWRAIDDDRFADVWPDDHALAWWLRLLIAADQSWPASAMLPAGVHRGGLKKLTDAGLVVVTKGRFRIHGLDSERSKRSRQGKAGAEARWSDEQMPTDTRTHSERTADALPTHPVRNASQDETRRDETRQDEHNGRADGEELDGIDLFREGLPHLDEETLKLGHEITGKPAREMGDKQLDELDRLLGEHGADRVRSAMRRVPPYEGKLSWQRVVWGARKVLEPLWEGKPETPRERAERDERERREHADAINAQFAKPGVA
jgi:hypothetical protein